MRPVKPSAIVNHLILATSVDKVLRSNVSIGSIDTYAIDGTPATFNQDNGDGVMVRVASTANPLGLTQFWLGNNVNTTITHNLGRIPIGYYVTKKTAACDVFDGTLAATTSTITLQCTTGATTDTVVYIF